MLSSSIKLNILLLLFVSFYFNGISFSQEDSIKVSPLNITGYIDVYYSYNFNNPASKEMSGFIFSHNRHNEFNINNAVVLLNYSTPKIRARVGLHTGTFIQANYAQDPIVLRFIHEANAGVRVNNDLWIDAGVFASHIGVESAISIDNWTLTRSLAAENSPYYETGVRAIFKPNDSWSFTGLVLNGWQNIRDYNSNKAFGTQIQFKPTQNILFNSSTFIGNENPDSLKAMRYFHDFYSIIQLSKSISVSGTFDLGVQEKFGGHKYNWWMAMVLITRFQFNESFATAIRGEWFNDRGRVVIDSPERFQTSAFSINFDYLIKTNALFRLEAKRFQADKNVFERNRSFSKDMFLVTASIAINFD